MPSFGGGGPNNPDPRLQREQLRPELAIAPGDEVPPGYGKNVANAYAPQYPQYPAATSQAGPWKQAPGEDDVW